MEDNNKSNQRQWSIDNLRAVAILIVVFGHSIIIYSNKWNLYSTEIECELLNKIKVLIDIVQMPLFFSISGYVFYWTMSRKNMKNIILDKIQRLLLPFVFFAFCWMLPIRLLLNYSGYEGQSIKNIVVKIIWGNDSGHLWYLPTLFLCFLIVCVVLKLEQSVSIGKKLVIINFFVIILLYIVRPLNAQPYLNSLYNYGAYFYLGYFINENKDVIKAIKENKITKSILLIMSVTMVCVSFFVSNRYLIELARVFMLICIYTYMERFDKKNRILSCISKNSFGIYLFHSPLIYITYTYLNNASPIIVVLLNFCVFGFLSLCLTMLFRKNLILRKFIGEM